MGPELVPLLLAGGGAILQSQSKQEQADEKRSILNRQLERDDATSKKAVNLVQNEGQNYGLDARKDALNTQEGKTLDQITTDMQGATLGATAGEAGNVSSDFTKDRASRAVDEGLRMTSIAKEVAKTRAPGMLQGEDGLRKANLSSTLQNIGGSNTNMARANSLDADAVQEPGYGALGSIASAIAPGFGGGSGSVGNTLLSRLKYGGTSIIPTAANYENSMDRMNAGGIFR